MNRTSRDPAGHQLSRDITLLWVSSVCAVFGAQLSTLALPLAVLRHTGSIVQAGLISTVSVLALIITMLPGGALADGVERRRLMRWCDVGALVITGCLFVMVANGRLPLPVVLLTAVAAAVLSTVYAPAALGLMRAATPVADLGRVATRLQAGNSAARLAGPLVGGALYGLQPAAPFAGQFLMILCSTTCVALVRTRSAPAADRRPMTSATEMLAGLSFIWRERWLRSILLVFGLGVNAAFAGTAFVAVVIASDGGESGIGGGLVSSALALGSLSGALLAPRLRPELHAARYIAAVSWSLPGALAVLVVTHPPALVAILTGTCMAAASIATIGFTTILLTLTPDHLVGRVQSAAGFTSSLVQPLGPVLAGAALQAWGASTTFGALAAIFLVCALAVTRVLLRTAQSRPAPADQQAPLVPMTAEEV